jgi:hypothetical protein
VESTAKAVELDANYFDALFQLGALYYNKGVRQTEFANTITGMSANEVKRYDAETKKAYYRKKNDEYAVEQGYADWDAFMADSIFANKKNEDKKN